MKIEVNGRNKVENSISWIAYEGVVDKKTSLTLEAGYSCVVYISGRRYDVFNNPGEYNFSRSLAGESILVYAFDGSEIACLFGIGEAGKVNNAYGQYKLVVTDRELFIEKFGIGKKEITPKVIRDFINPELPNILRDCNNIDEANKALEVLLKSKLQSRGLSIKSCNIEEINFK